MKVMNVHPETKRRGMDRRHTDEVIDWPDVALKNRRPCVYVRVCVIKFLCSFHCVNPGEITSYPSQTDPNAQPPRIHTRDEHFITLLFFEGHGRWMMGTAE